MGVARKGTLPLVLYESQTGTDLYLAGTFSRLGLATKSIMVDLRISDTFEYYREVWFRGDILGIA